MTDEDGGREKTGRWEHMYHQRLEYWGQNGSWNRCRRLSSRPFEWQGCGSEVEPGWKPWSQRRWESQRSCVSVSCDR